MFDTHSLSGVSAVSEENSLYSVSPRQTLFVFYCSSDEVSSTSLLTKQCFGMWFTQLHRLPFRNYKPDVPFSNDGYDWIFATESRKWSTLIDNGIVLMVLPSWSSKSAEREGRPPGIRYFVPVFCGSEIQSQADIVHFSFTMSEAPPGKSCIMAWIELTEATVVWKLLHVHDWHLRWHDLKAGLRWLYHLAFATSPCGWAYLWCGSLWVLELVTWWLWAYGYVFQRKRWLFHCLLWLILGNHFCYIGQFCLEAT